MSELDLKVILRDLDNAAAQHRAYTDPAACARAIRVLQEAVSLALQAFNHAAQRWDSGERSDEFSAILSAIDMAVGDFKSIADHGAFWQLQERVAEQFWDEWRAKNWSHADIAAAAKQKEKRMR